MSFFQLFQYCLGSRVRHHWWLLFRAAATCRSVSHSLGCRLDAPAVLPNRQLLNSRLMTHRIQIRSRLIFNSISSSAREGTRERVQCMRQINPWVGEYRGRRPETEPNWSLTPSGQVFYFPYGFLGHSPSGVQVGASLGDVVYTFRDKTSTCSW